MVAPPRPRLVDRNDASKPRELPVGTVVLGRYTIQKVLGRGGMATVYLARHQQTERLVALKLLDPEISRDPSYVERFRREARAAGRIRSDYVVAIYDLDAEVGGGLVLVMEYLEGQTVQQALRGGRLPIQKVLSFGRHVLEGLAAAHAASVIHRDLKPANLFVERSSTGSEKCKILDFGISKLADASQQELTRDGQTLGTVAYMAPEQIRGKASSTDPRVDLYAAGVTLFIMFTGKRPIDADDTVQLLAAVLENPPLSLAQATGVPFPQPLEDFFVRALQKNPDHRFQTALEMRDALVEAGRSVGYEATGVLQVPAVSAPIAVPGATGPHRALGGVESTPSGGRSGVVPSRSPTSMGMGAPPIGAPRPTLVGVPGPSAANMPPPVLGTAPHGTVPPGALVAPPSRVGVPAVSSPGIAAPPPASTPPGVPTATSAGIAGPPPAFPMGTVPPGAGPMMPPGAQPPLGAAGSIQPYGGLPPGMGAMMTVPHQVPGVGAGGVAVATTPPGEITEVPPAGTSTRMKLALVLAALGTAALVATAVVLTLRASPTTPAGAATHVAAPATAAPTPPSGVNPPPAPRVTPTPTPAPVPAANSAPPPSANIAPTPAPNPPRAEQLAAPPARVEQPAAPPARVEQPAPRREPAAPPPTTTASSSVAASAPHREREPAPAGPTNPPPTPASSDPHAAGHSGSRHGSRSRRPGIVEDAPF